MNNYPYYKHDDRFFPVGAFLFGALTGGVATAAFNPYKPRPYYPINNQMPVQYSYYSGPPINYPPMYYRPY